MTAAETSRIRALNDDLRRHLSRTSELAFMTPGIAALGKDAVDQTVLTIATYDDFCHANDPHEEHDFGSFETEAQRSSLRSIITIVPSPTILPIQPIHR